MKRTFFSHHAGTIYQLNFFPVALTQYVENRIKHSITVSLFGKKYKQTSNHAPQRNKPQKNSVYLVPKTPEIAIRFSIQMPRWIAKREKKNKQTKKQTQAVVHFSRELSRLSNVNLFLNATRHTLPEHI